MKISRCVTLTLVTMPPRKSSAFTFYSSQRYPSDDEGDDPPIPHTEPINILGQRHVDLNSNRVYGVPRKARNVYLPSVASPAAAPTLPHRSDHESSWNTEPPPPSDFYELYPFADPSYQHSLDMMDPEVAPRRRTKSVSITVVFYCNYGLTPQRIQDHPLLNWIPGIDTFMREILRLEGRGDHCRGGLCPLCESSDAVYRCSDCFGGELYCQGCIVYLHSRTPLHRLQVRLT